MLCNKSDLLNKDLTKEQLENYISQKELDAFAKENCFAGTSLISAKNGTNVSEAFASLFKEVLVKKAKLGEAKPSAVDPTIIKLKTKAVTEKSRKKCC